MNLEQLRKQAKELVKAARAGDDAALARLGDLPTILASAQTVLARERGYRGWAALVDALQASPDAFVRAATTPRRERAERLLAARPEIASDRYAALVLGRGWDGDPNEPGGPRMWPPLAYVCHAPFPPLDAARELLERGADPNAVFENDWGSVSMLFGATAVQRSPELIRLLVVAGADVDDSATQFGDSLYHSVEHATTECLRALLDAGAEPNGTNALAHALDYDHLEHVRMLLDAGADANEGALVAHAVRRGRGPDFIRLLAERGGDLNRPGGETWRGDVPLRTPYQHALLRGRDDVAATLVELGASAAPFERNVPIEDDPDAQEAIILSVLDRRRAPEDVGVEFRGVVGGGPSGTLLHHASWVGDAELVRELLAAGAGAQAPSDAHFSTPSAWAALGSEAWREPRRDYVAVMETLVAAGAELEPRFLEVAHGPLAEWLEARL